MARFCWPTWRSGGESCIPSTKKCQISHSFGWNGGDWGRYYWGTRDSSTSWIETGILRERELDTFYHLIFHLPLSTMGWSEFHNVSDTQISRGQILIISDMITAIMLLKFSHLWAILLLDRIRSSLFIIGIDWVYRSQEFFASKWCIWWISTLIYRVKFYSILKRRHQIYRNCALFVLRSRDLGTKTLVLHLCYWNGHCSIYHRRHFKDPSTTIECNFTLTRVKCNGCHVIYLCMLLFDGMW